jgi:hypothetical protein
LNVQTINGNSGKNNVMEMINKLIKSVILISLITLYSSSFVYAWGWRSNKPEQENKGSGIQLNFGGNGNSDGGERRKNDAGNRAENQAYSDYKRWVVGIAISVMAVPHQDGNRYTGMEGISGFIEHNMSEYFLIGVTHIDQKFSHLDNVYDESIHHKHTAAYAGFRKWITERTMVGARIGIADSKVDYLGEELKGQSEYLALSLDYALSDDDSSRIGYRYSSLTGKDKAGERNIGMNLHSLTFQVLF